MTLAAWIYILGLIWHCVGAGLIIHVFTPKGEPAHPGIVALAFCFGGVLGIFAGLMLLVRKKVNDSFDPWGGVGS